MNASADGAEFRRLHKAGTQERDRNPSEVEIELHSCAHEERTRQELTEFPTPNCEIDRRAAGHDDGCDENRHRHGSEPLLEPRCSSVGSWIDEPRVVVKVDLSDGIEPKL